MKIFNTILFLVVLFVLGACRANRQVTQTKETIIGSSSVRFTKYRDTILHAPGSSTGFQLPLSALAKCPNGSAPKSADKTYTQKNGNATAKVVIKHDTITVTAECDSVALAAKIRQDFEKNDFSSVKNSDRSETVTKTNFWDGLVSILIALAVGFVLGKIIKI